MEESLPFRSMAEERTVAILTPFTRYSQDPVVLHHVDCLQQMKGYYLIMEHVHIYHFIIGLQQYCTPQNICPVLMPNGSRSLLYERKSLLRTLGRKSSVSSASNLRDPFLSRQFNGVRCLFVPNLPLGSYVLR